jgi:hypothetical protein
MKLRIGLLAATGVWTVIGISAAHAGILNFEAQLKGPSASQSTAAHARGEVNAMLDTDRRLLEYTVTYSGLSGPAVSAGFEAGGSAAVVVAPAADKSHSIHGVAELTDAQISDLAAGRWSFDIRTSANPNGELHGQVRRTSNF